jgi:hypothetical protein
MLDLGRLLVTFLHLALKIYAVQTDDDQILDLQNTENMISQNKLH